MATIIYTVKPGDTLWTIAERYKTTVNDIARYNGIADPDVIYVGQQLRIMCPDNMPEPPAPPVHPMPPMPPEVPEWYTVRPGDTLWNIANKFGTTVGKLQWLNDIPNPDLIYPRQRLRVRP